MFKLYIGNLPPNITDGTLSSLFREQGIECSHILLKTNYAFVDCPDQANLDKAIDVLHGYKLQGFEMQVEPSVSRRRKTNKIQIRNVPTHISKDEIDHLISSLGNVQRCDLAGAEGVVYVTYDNPELAQQAVTQLNGYDFHGSILKVDFVGNRIRNNRMNNNGNAAMSVQDIPLRILVGREYVGAIIGKQGQTIKNITSQSNARIDVHRPPDNSAPETLVTIKGSPESCTTACKELMKVVQQEAQTLNRGECPLRVLCPNSLCGRMIGKRGKVIKDMMQESDSHIVVSSITDSNMNNYFIDRVITVKGSVDSMSKAEKIITERMKRCFAQDAQQMAIPPCVCDPFITPMGLVTNPALAPAELCCMYQPMSLGLPAFAMMPGINSFPGLRSPYPPYMEQGSVNEREREGILHSLALYQDNTGGSWYPGFCGLLPNPQPPQQQPEVCYLYIPERTVGSIIGSKGINIQNIKRESNARIKILPPNKGENNGERKGPVLPTDERKVIIVGNSEAQWKAQFYLYEKVREEVAGNDELRLRLEIMIPRSIIGRIIGRGGQNLRELRRVSKASVKLPDDLTDEEVPVSMIGNFYALQAAQRRIRDLMASALQNPGPQQGPVPPPPPPPPPLPQQNRRIVREQDNK